MGASLPGGVEIQSVHIYGELSEGMLCSEQDLGLSGHHVGVIELDNDTALGTPIEEALDFNDTVVDLDLTPNRGDCFSVLGVAREVAVLMNSDVQSNLPAPQKKNIDDTLPIELMDPDGCPLYLGRVIKNVDVVAPTPTYITKNLLCSGIRPINVIVDILNFVMIEIGQPMHAFDLKYVQAGIKVRRANKDEELTLLDGSEAELDEETLVIAAQDQPLAIAGVMGGLDSSVTDATKDILLEVAYFQPHAVHGTARKYGLQTDASIRYERGVDYTLPDRAVEYASSLLKKYAGGDLGPVCEARSSKHMPSTKSVEITDQRLAHLIGQRFPADTVGKIFQTLEFNPERTFEGWKITVPPHRFDIEIPEDLVEEVCRVIGYNNIRDLAVTCLLTPNPVMRPQGNDQGLRAILCSLGYSETVSYSFIDREHNKIFASSERFPTVLNPMSQEREIMRFSLIPGLLHVVSHNLARQENDIKAFEFGQCFEYIEDRLLQENHIGAACSGARSPQSWANDTSLLDFFDVKGDIEAMFGSEKLTYKPTKESWLQPGQGADLYAEECVCVGSMGKVSTDVTEVFEIDKEVFVFEIRDLSFVEHKPDQSKQLSVYPSIRRDLALIVDKSVSAASIKQVICSSLGVLLENFTVFDVYKDKNFEENQHSIGIGVTLRHQDRTLSDEEVSEKIDRVISLLQAKFDAKLRT